MAQEASATGGGAVIVATTHEIAGYRIVRHIGLVRGIAVRSRSSMGNLAGGLQFLLGGRLRIYVKLAETARREAADRMAAEAGQGGANAVVGMRYEANEIMEGITEVLAYGTAVIVEPIQTELTPKR